MCDLCDRIKLTCGKYAIVDRCDRRRIGLTGWKAKLSRGGWYAYKVTIKNGRKKYIYMHRLINNTPRDKECHHKDRNLMTEPGNPKTCGLYNRRKNLINLTPNEHEQLSRLQRISKKT